VLFFSNSGNFYNKHPRGIFSICLLSGPCKKLRWLKFGPFFAMEISKFSIFAMYFYTAAY
jgi:hypothetical protein